MNTLPATMRAMVLHGHGDIDQYTLHEDWPTPAADEMEVVIKVAACGMNNTDINTRSGWYSKAVSEATTGGAYGEVSEEDPTWGGAPISFPRIQGADVVGHVVQVGDGVPETWLGKRVMTNGWLRDWDDPNNFDKTGYFGSECDGGFAEYTKTDVRCVAKVNSAYSDAELATFSCSYCTAEGMLTRANVSAADTVLIPGASGGVGSALVQLAKLRGARVIGMAQPHKHADVAALGADRLIDRNAEQLQSLLADERITVVADVVGGPLWAQLIDLLVRGGRYTCSGAIAGPMVSLDLRTFYLRDLTFTGSTVNDVDVFPRVVNYIEQGKLKPVLAATYPLAELGAAQQAFIAKAHTGNLVIEP